MDRNLKLLAGMVGSALLLALATPSVQELATSQAPAAPAAPPPADITPAPPPAAAPGAQPQAIATQDATIMGEPTMDGQPIAYGNAVSGAPMMDPTPRGSSSAPAQQGSAPAPSGPPVPMPDPGMAPPPDGSAPAPNGPPGPPIG